MSMSSEKKLANHLHSITTTITCQITSNLLSARGKFYNRAIPVICSKKWTKRSAKPIHFQWDQGFSDTIDGRGPTCKFPIARAQPN